MILTVKSSALWGLGRVEFAIKNNAAALETLWQLTSQYPASPNAVRAYILIGEIFTLLGKKC